MAIVKIAFPISSPAGVSDYQQQNLLIAALAKNVDGALKVVGSNVVQGAIFNCGGSVYVADADTAISGTASDYVKLTVSGSNLVPSFVASLAGVNWNKEYKGYYDVSGNLYEFKELKALAAAAISSIQKRYVESDAIGTGWATELLARANTNSLYKGLRAGRGYLGTREYSWVAGGVSSTLHDPLFALITAEGLATYERISARGLYEGKHIIGLVKATDTHPGIDLWDPATSNFSSFTFSSSGGATLTATGFILID
jgi:hypothetical protein